jgi:opacity protein-like surface antigen
LIKRSVIHALSGIGLLVSGLAQASDNPFSGPSIAIGFGSRAIGSQIDTSTETAMLAQHINKLGNTTVEKTSNNQSALLPVVDLSYGFSLNDDWITSVGINFEPGKSSGGKSTLAYGNTDIAATLSMKNHLSFYVAPGRRLGENWLLYGKLSLHQIDAEHGLELKNASSSHSPATVSSRLRGVGIGVGAKWAMAKNLTLGMGVDFIRFDKFTHRDQGVPFYSNKPNMIQTDLQLGYHF